VSTTAQITVADLRPVDLFDGIDDEQLQRWVDVAEERRYEPGTIIAEGYKPPPGVHILLEGTVRTMIVHGDRTEPVGRHLVVDLGPDIGLGDERRRRVEVPGLVQQGRQGLTLRLRLLGHG